MDHPSSWRPLDVDRVIETDRVIQSLDVLRDVIDRGKYPTWCDRSGLQVRISYDDSHAIIGLFHDSTEVLTRVFLELLFRDDLHAVMCDGSVLQVHHPLPKPL